MSEDRKQLERAHEQNGGQRKQVEFQEAPGETEAATTHTPLVNTASSGTAGLVTSLAHADSATRAQVVSRLQQTQGNAFVQRVVTQARESAGHDGPDQAQNQSGLAVQRDPVPSPSPVAQSKQPAKPARTKAGTGGGMWAVYENEVRVGGSLAWRNNNPGNLRASDMAIGKYKGFAIFADRDTGRAALKALLKSSAYQSLTIEATISKYAPASDHNDPAAYTQHIRKQTGLDPSRVMNTLTDEELESVMNAIEKMEGWIEGKTYTCADKTAPQKYRTMLGCS